MLIGEDAQGPVFHLFFLTSRFGMVAPTDTSVGMDPSAGETVGRMGLAPLVISAMERFYLGLRYDGRRTLMEGLEEGLG